MLCELPLDILRAVLEDHLLLDARHARCLDVAFCNRKLRPDLLQVLRQIANIQPKLYTSNDLSACLTWIASRGVKVPKLLVEFDAAACSSQLIPADLQAAGIEMVHIFHNDEEKARKDAPQPVESIVGLLKHFPSLTSLRCWSSLSSKQLTALQCIRAIQELDLSNCPMNQLSQKAIAEFACSFGDQLRVLKCREILSDVLPAIAQSCHMLEEFNGTFESFSQKFKSFRTNTSDDIEGFVALCAANPMMKRLRLRGRTWPTNVLKRMLGQCLRLTHFQHVLAEIECSHITESADIVPFLLTNCPLMAMIQFTNLQVKVVLVDGRRMVEMQHLIEMPVDKELAFINALPLPVRAYCSQIVHSSGNLVALQCLVDRHADTLQVLDIGIYDGLSRDGLTDTSCIHQLIQRCPNLQEYVIGPWTHGAALESMRALVACRKLRKLTIFEHHRTECKKEDNLSVLFDAFQGVRNGLTHLALPSQLPVSKLTLQSIIAAFPHLHSIVMPSTDLDRVALLRLIRSGKVQWKRITLRAANATVVSNKLFTHGIHHQLRGDVICFPLEHVLPEEPPTFIPNHDSEGVFLNIEPDSDDWRASGEDSDAEDLGIEHFHQFAYHDGNGDY